MSQIALSPPAAGTGVFTIASPATNTNQTLTLPDATGTVLSVDSAGAVLGAPLLHLNDIINGDFRIAQAGTSFAASPSGAYDLDGWLNENGSSAILSVAQVAGSTAGRLARQVTITTADAAVAAGDFSADVTKIEGSNVEKYVGNTFTVAFRAKVPVVGIHCVSLRNSGADRSYVVEINFPTANVYQNCSFTVVGGLPTNGTWNFTNGVGLQIFFSHMVGTTFQTTPNAWNTGNFLGTANQVNDCATAGNVWALEKVTLNLGTVAAVSEISIGAELVRCQRYFIIKTAVVTSASVFLVQIHFVPMRVTPTIGAVVFDVGTGATFSNTNPGGTVFQSANHSGIATATSIPLSARL